MENFSIDPRSSLGPVQLYSADLASQATFYSARIGMEVLSQGPSAVSLGIAGRELLRFVHSPGAIRHQGRTGLYHFCIGVKQRMELGRLLQRLLSSHTPLDGLVDHRMADAIYLTDPEGNGIELNWDHPRETWPAFKEFARLGNGPLDAEELLALADKAGPGNGKLPADAWISHIHLHVADLAEASAFYHGVLGLDLTMELPRQAIFTSAGGYHHHIAFNIWQGKGASAPPPGALGLKRFTLLLPDKASLETENARLKEAGIPSEPTADGILVKDPSQNGLLLKIA